MCATPRIDPGKQPDAQIYYGGDGFSYYVNRREEAHNPNVVTIYLRCHLYRSGCRGTARLFQTPEGIEWIAGQGHSCLPNFLASDVRRLRNEVLTACKSRDYVPPKRLLNSISARYDVDVAAELRGGGIRHAMARARASLYPRAPATLRRFARLIEDPQNAHLVATLDGTDSVYAATVGPPGERCSIFVSRRIRQFLPKVKQVFADATFVPTPVKPNGSQVYQIVTLRKNNVIPLVQVIMERKSYESYRAVLLWLRHHVPRFNPRFVMTDYERQQQRAWQEIYPRAYVRGCYFHFVRAVATKAGKLGLKQLGHTLRGLRSIIRACCAIPLLPHTLMVRGFHALVREALGKGLGDVLVPFFYYFITTWLTSWRSETVSVYDQLNRTNNACEAGQKSLRTETGPHHPNLWMFLNAIRRYEQSAFTDIRAWIRGRRFGRTRKASAILNDQRLKNYTGDLLAGNITIRKFLHVASTRVMNVFNMYLP